MITLEKRLIVNYIDGFIIYNKCKDFLFMVTLLEIIDNFVPYKEFLQESGN